MMRARSLHPLLAVVLLAAPRPMSSTPAPEIAIEMRVVAHAPVEPRVLSLARATTTTLVETTGVRVAWRECPAADVACASHPGNGGVVVRLVSSRLSNPRVCGGVIPAGADGQVMLIFLTCHERLMETVRTMAAARSEPPLATLEIGHLLGLTMAHELGHVLGLAHAPAGVMRARFDIADFRALRTSSLAFRSHEQRWMRQAMLARRGGGQPPFSTAVPAAGSKAP